MSLSVLTATTDFLKRRKMKLNGHCFTASSVLSYKRIFHSLKINTNRSKWKIVSLKYTSHQVDLKAVIHKRQMKFPRKTPSLPKKLTPLSKRVEPHYSSLSKWEFVILVQDNKVVFNPRHAHVRFWREQCKQYVRQREWDWKWVAAYLNLKCIW